MRKGVAALTCIVAVLLAWSAVYADPLTDAPVCLQVNGDPNVIAKLVFKKLAENIYSFTAIISNGSDLHNVMGGSAFIGSNNIFVSSYQSGRDSAAMWTGNPYFVLDKNSLNGSFEGIGHDYNYVDHSTDTEYSTGYLTHVSCP